VLCVCTGLVVTTLSQPSVPMTVGGDAGSELLLGVGCMVTALAARAGGSAVQEVVFRRYGAHVEEVLFWKSVLGERHLHFLATRGAGRCKLSHATGGVQACHSSWRGGSLSRHMRRSGWSAQ
jgi:hypothetical protein